MTADVTVLKPAGLTVAETAELLGTTRSAVQSLIDRGALRVTQIPTANGESRNGLIRITFPALAGYLDQCRQDESARLEASLAQAQAAVTELAAQVDDLAAQVTEVAGRYRAALDQVAAAVDAGTFDGYPPYLTRVQVARLLNVSQRKLDHMIAAGEIGSVLIGTSRRIPLAGLTAYLRHLEGRTATAV